MTTSVFGNSRLPEVVLPDGPITTDNRGDIFPLLNAQITHVFHQWDFYIGGENLTNYRQKNPIIDSESPFSKTFDATRVWAPVFGVNVYAGVRFTIEHKEDEL